MAKVFTLHGRNGLSAAGDLYLQAQTNERPIYAHLLVSQYFRFFYLDLRKSLCTWKFPWTGGLWEGKEGQRHSEKHCLLNIFHKHLFCVAR